MTESRHYWTVSYSFDWAASLEPFFITKPAPYYFRAGSRFQSKNRIYDFCDPGSILRGVVNPNIVQNCAVRISEHFFVSFARGF